MRPVRGGAPAVIGEAQAVRAGLGTRAVAPGIQVANTTFDFQQNDAVPHMIATNGGGRVVHFAYMWWFYIPDSLTQVDRFVKFNTYDPGAGAFLFGADGVTIGDGEGDARKARAGFPALDIDDQDRALVALQARAWDQQPSGDFSSWILQQQSPKLSLFLQEQMLQSVGTVANPDDDMVWPHVTVDQISGTWDVYHVVAHTYATNNDVVYWRYKVTDVPQWQGPIVVDSSQISLSYNVATDRTSDKVALITIDSDTTVTNPFGLRQVTYRESPDNGSSWIDGTGLGNSHEVMITSYTDPTGPEAWLECVGDYDNGGNLHVVWVEQHDPGMWSTSGQSSLKHWDKASGTASSIATAFYDNKGMTSGRKLNIGFPSLGFGDGSTLCDDHSNLNYLYVTYVQFGGPTTDQQNDKSADGYMNGEICLAVSDDGGAHWCRPVNLTNTPSPGCNPANGDSCQSENSPSIARTVDDTIHVMYIADRDAGDCVFGQGRWTYNPVMYYRIPGGTDVQPVCPAVVPTFSATLSDANGPECEYNAGPNSNSINETLTISNTGNSGMIGSVDVVYTNPPSGSWLTVTGAGSYTIPVDAPDLTYPVAMNPAGLTEGLYQAVISITHNDTTQPNPFQIPVDFFVFDDFQCPEYVVLHTHWLWLEVSNVGRLARSNPHGGLYRWPLPGTPDSGNSSIRDASLLIAKTPSPDTFVYRNIYGAGNGQPGFRAQSPLVIDTTAYGTNTGFASAKTTLTTIDSAIGIDVEYLFPQKSDSSAFVLINYRIYNRTNDSIPGLMIGEAADFDVLPSSQYAQLQVDACNAGGFSSYNNLIYQQGVDWGATTQAARFLGGMTAIQCEVSRRAWTAPNNPWLTLRPGGGFHEGYLYQEMSKVGFETKPPDYGIDRHAVIVFEKDVNLKPTTVKHYMLGFVSSTGGPSSTDLIAQTKKAWKFAFGWNTFTDLDTLDVNTPSSYPYYALGSHENGPMSGCCGCVITKTSDPTGKFSFTPETNPCSGTINFSGADRGTYTATFRVATPSCSGPTYTEYRTMAIVVRYANCDCPHQGDIIESGFIDVQDVVQIITVAFVNGDDITDPNCPKSRCDVDGSGVVDVQDVVYIIKTAFTNGPYPLNPCF